METVFNGTAWVGGNDIAAFQIVPLRRWDMDCIKPEELSQWVMEEMEERFVDVPNAFKNEGYSFIVAGTNFGGGGKSVEHPIMGVKAAGIKIVLAESFARYNYRNSINNGLLAFECDGIASAVKTGDVLTVDIDKGTVTNETTGAVLKIAPMSNYARSIIEAGGLIPFTRKKFEK